MRLMIIDRQKHGFARYCPAIAKTLNRFLDWKQDRKIEKLRRTISDYCWLDFFGRYNGDVGRAEHRRFEALTRLKDMQLKQKHVESLITTLMFVAENATWGSNIGQAVEFLSQPLFFEHVIAILAEPIMEQEPAKRISEIRKKIRAAQAICHVLDAIWFDPKQQEDIVISITQCFSSEWFMEEMAKNSDNYIDTISAFANIMQKLSNKEQGIANEAKE